MFGSQVVVVGVSEIDGGELLCLVHNGGEWQFVDVSVSYQNMICVCGEQTSSDNFLRK